MSRNTPAIIQAIRFLFFIAVSLAVRSVTASGVAKITVDLRVSPKPDTLYLLKYPAIRYKGFSPPEVLQALRESSGLYRFELNVSAEKELYSISRKIDNDTANVYFKDFKGSSYEYFSLTGEIYFRAGDDVTLTISKHKPDNPVSGLWFDTYKTQISGPGGAMHYAKLKTDSLLFRAHDPKPSFDENLNYHHNQERVKKLALSYLDSVRHQVPGPYSNLIRTDIIYYVPHYLFSRLEAFYRSYRSAKDPAAEAVFKNAYESAIDRYFTQQIGSPDENSDNYIRFISKKASFDSYIAGVPEPAEYAFNLLASQYSGLVRDRAIVTLFTSGTIEIPSTVYEKAVPIVKNKECKSLVNLLGARKQGSPAYNFALEDTDGVTHRLSDMKGKWIYIDFWFTGCSVCKYFFENILEETEQHFAGNPAIAFVSISADKSKARWLKSVEKGTYTARHSLNLYTNEQGWDHELILHYGISSYPSAILVDPNGKIYRYNTSDLLVRSVPDLIATLEAYMGKTGELRE